MKNQISLTFMLLLFVVLNATAQGPTRLLMHIGTIWCDHTTEAGEDEVLISMAAQTFDGRHSSGVWPTNTNGASINDGKGPRQYNNIDFDIPLLYAGQQCNVKLAVAEIDGGTSDAYSRAAQAGLSAVCPENPYCLGAIGFLELCDKVGLKVSDTDDFIGAITINLSVDNSGYLHASWSNAERCFGVYSWNNTPNAMIIQFVGDGSDYKLYVQFYFY